MRTLFCSLAVIWASGMADSEIEIVEIELEPGKYESTTFYHAAVDDGQQVKSGPVGPGFTNTGCLETGEKVSICKQSNGFTIDAANQFQDSGWCQTSNSETGQTLILNSFYRIDRANSRLVLIVTSNATSDEGNAVSVVETTMTRLGVCDPS